MKTILLASAAFAMLGAASASAADLAARPAFSFAGLLDELVNQLRQTTRAGGNFATGLFVSDLQPKIPGEFYTAFFNPVLRAVHKLGATELR